MNLLHSSHHYRNDDHDKAVVSSYAVWNNFFLSAGIPEQVANEYAMKFSHHRIRIDMLGDITKEILLDMGIKAMGDIIAILRHAKNLHTQDELKGSFKSGAGGPTTIANSNKIVSTTSNINNNTNNHRNNSTAVHHISQRTPITTIRTVPSISSLVGNKIQSRVSSASGALLASSNHSASVSSSSSASRAVDKKTSLARRLGPNPDTVTGSRRSLPEKTLTVHYPSSEAVAKAQQRLFSNSIQAAQKQQSQTKSTNNSIKSRLGLKPNDSNHRHDRSKNQARINDTNNKPSSTSLNSRLTIPMKQKHQKSSIKTQSTVFSRLGNGSRSTR